MAAAAAGRGSTPSGGSGCCDNRVISRTHGDNREIMRTHLVIIFVNAKMQFAMERFH